SFEDFLVSVGDIEDADYTRRADEEVKGMSCYVVEAVMRPEADSSYTRTKNWIEKEHYVPVKTEYWDEADVLAKRMEARHDSISEFGGTWIATDSTMHDLLEDTRSRLVVDLLEPEPGLTDSDFALSNLQQRP
ncbi:MAG: outer membrane lipoprotein-sorting protein, partial [Deltaproteobacteria bacterium]|nr:outer membrane lipoprotein-sorting protein [Deltaproteobacteria bacterium]